MLWPHRQECLSQSSYKTKIFTPLSSTILDWLIYWWLDLVFSWSWRWSSSVGGGCHGGGDLYAWDHHHEHQDRDEVRNIFSLLRIFQIMIWLFTFLTERISQVIWWWNWTWRKLTHSPWLCLVLMVWAAVTMTSARSSLTWGPVYVTTFLRDSPVDVLCCRWTEHSLQTFEDN